MKNTLITAVLIFTSSSFAAANLSLKGVVATKLSADVTALPVALTLPLDISQTDLKVASGTFKSNSGTGFKIVVQSTNLGNLKRDGGSELFPYSMKFGSMSIPLSQSSPVIYTNSGLLNITDNFNISYTGKLNTDMTAGTYLDTITITMSAL